MRIGEHVAECGKAPDPRVSPKGPSVTFLYKYVQPLFYAGVAPVAWGAKEIFVL